MGTPTTFVNFDAIDFRGVESLSSYALEQTPITFIPKIRELYGNRVLWNFGDGTTSSSLTARKSYKFPGKYTVNLVVYDCFDNALYSAQNKNITIYDYIPHTFVVEDGDKFYANVDDDVLYASPIGEFYVGSSPLTGFEIYNGKISGPYKIKSYYPLYQKPSDIYVDFIGSGSVDYFDIHQNKYAHLRKNYSLFDSVYNYSLSAVQYEEIDKIVPENTPIYARIKNSNIVICLSGDEGSFLVGVGGYKNFYLKDDTENNNLNLKFYFDKNDVFLESENNCNTTSINLSCQVIPNYPYRVTITTNGHDGEGAEINSFNIPEINYVGVEIPFVIKIKDFDNFTIKNFKILDLSNLQFYIDLYFGEHYTYVDPLSSGEYLQPNNIDSYLQPILYDYYFDITSLNDTLLGENFGSFRGSLKFKNLSSGTYIDNVIIKCVIDVVDDQNISHNLIGYSNPFKIVPLNYYDFYKNGEDYDFKEALKDLRFQEFLLDDSVLFDDFLGSVFGDSTSSYETLGKKIYEKITNFVQNHSDIDRNEIFSLLSQMEMLDVEQNTYNSSFIRYPEQIRRILNMASIAKNKITGKPNKFAEAFARGGQNLGSEINTTTYTVSAGSPLVAFERFSGDYTLLNTFQPVSATESFIYPLSAYADTWGWPLVLPNPFSFVDIEKYYTFYEYVSGYENTVYGSSIDFDNALTTIPLTATSSELFDGGIFENMLVDKFTNLLKLNA
jgi:hypothetical protein